MLNFLDDLLVLIGCALLIYGVAQIYPPAAWIVAGGLAIGGGFMLGMANREKTEARRDH